MILECQVLCLKEGNENLGEKNQDIWLPLAIDMNEIFAVKKNGGEDSETDQRAVLWHKAGDYFVIDLSYEEMLRNWKEFQKLKNWRNQK